MRADDDSAWDRAESAHLAACFKVAGTRDQPGENASHGSRLEFVLSGAIGREWQCGTLQVGFVLPGRLGAGYVDRDGSRKSPVMLHRAILGSFERFIGILLEHHAGHLPFWMSPVQAVVATITPASDAYALEVTGTLADAGMSAETDLRNAKINHKVREHSLAKVPVILAVGQREAVGRTVSVRRLGSRQSRSMPLAEAVAELAGENAVPDSGDGDAGEG